MESEALLHENGKAIPGAEAPSFFSSATFAHAVVAGLRATHQVYNVDAPEPEGRLYGVAARGRFGTRTVMLAPFGLPASPGWIGDLKRHTVEYLVACLKRPWTAAFIWNVRFDQLALKRQLENLGLSAQISCTHVLRLREDYERVLAGYNATRRWESRRARERLTVRRADPKEVAAFHDLQHRVVSAGSPFRPTVPLETLLRLSEDQSVRVFLAEQDGEIAAGGVFVRDNCVVAYWQGAVDRRFGASFPGTAVVDTAIRWGCESGAAMFNFGASGEVSSLEASRLASAPALPRAGPFVGRTPSGPRSPGCAGATEHIIA